MAEIYKRVRGQKIAKYLAKLPEVQKELDDRILEIGMRAEADHAQHYFDGHSYIEVDSGRVDRYVTLNDDRGQRAAMSIEYGREPYVNAEGHLIGGMEGLFILHRAAHLKKKQR